MPFYFLGYWQTVKTQIHIRLTSASLVNETWRYSHMSLDHVIYWLTKSSFIPFSVVCNLWGSITLFPKRSRNSVIYEIKANKTNFNFCDHSYFHLTYIITYVRPPFPVKGTENCGHFVMSWCWSWDSWKQSIHANLTFSVGNLETHQVLIEQILRS